MMLSFKPIRHLKASQAHFLLRVLGRWMMLRGAPLPPSSELSIETLMPGYEIWGILDRDHAIGLVAFKRSVDGTLHLHLIGAKSRMLDKESIDSFMSFVRSRREVLGASGVTAIIHATNRHTAKVVEILGFKVTPNSYPVLEQYKTYLLA